MEDFLDVLFMVHEKVTDFLATIIFIIPVYIEWCIWAFKLFNNPKNDDMYRLYRLDKEYRNKVAYCFVKKYSKIYKLKRRFQIYCCPIHVEW